MLRRAEPLLLCAPDSGLHGSRQLFLQFPLMRSQDASAQPKFWYFMKRFLKHRQGLWRRAGRSRVFDVGATACIGGDLDHLHVRGGRGPGSLPGIVGRARWWLVWGNIDGASTGGKGRGVMMRCAAWFELCSSNVMNCTCSNEADQPALFMYAATGRASRRLLHSPHLACCPVRRPGTGAAENPPPLPVAST